MYILEELSSLKRVIEELNLIKSFHSKTDNIFYRKERKTPFEMFPIYNNICVEVGSTPLFITKYHLKNSGV